MHGCGGIAEAKGCEVRLGNLARPVCSAFSWLPLSSEIRVLFSSGCGEAPVPCGFFNLFQGKKDWGPSA